MKKEDAYYLGKIVKTYGIKGELLAKIDTDEPQNYENITAVFLDINGKLVPYFLNKTQLHKTNTLRMDFEDIHSLEDAENILGKEIYLPLKDLPELTGNKFYFHEIIGFKAIDSKKGEIGTIVSVNDNSPQTYFVIKNSKNQEILIPLSDDILKEVDRKNKQIIFDTPEGLIDIYTA